MDGSLRHQLVQMDVNALAESINSPAKERRLAF